MNLKVIDRLADVNRPRGTEDHLSVTFPDARPRFFVPPKAALLAAGIVALIVGVLLARTLFLGGPPPPAPTPAQASASVGTEQAAGEIIVSVVGAVRSPGLVTLNAGDRVADAIAAAGGLVDGADPTAINQAQLVVDGQQLVIPAAGGSPPAAAGAAPAGSDLVSLNSADAAQLTTLDGVGEATAAAIISHREEIGGFTTIEQLLDVSGIGPAKFEKIRDHVTL